MVRFIGADGGNIANQVAFEPELPQFPGMNQPAPPPVSMIVPDDIGAMMGMDGENPEMDEPPDHDDNLAETLDENYLNKTGRMIVDKVAQDIADRKPWMDRLERGQEMMGHVKSEMDDGMFPGASTVVMSLMSEAVTHHWALGFGETWPSEGPAKAKVWGEQTVEKTDAASRVAEYLNYSMTFEDDDGYNEHSRCMYLAPYHGCSFKKIYPDTDLDRTVGVCVEAMDIIVPPRTMSLKNATRYTHRMYRTENEMKRLIRSGFYIDAGLGSPTADSTNDDAQKSRDEQQGVTAPTEEDRYTLFETCIDLDVPGLEDRDKFGRPTGVALPYVVTVEEKSGKVLGFRRNWREDDKLKRRRIYLVKYDFIPGQGFYGIGLIHLIGGLQSAATGVLRELIDSGALASLQGGFVTRDANLRGQRLVVEPGVWKPIDATSEQLSKGFFSPPFKEPSPTLFQLLGFLIGRGEKMIGTTDIQTGDADAKAPVGSVIAILEQGAKVYTTIHRGYHNSMSDELKIRFQLARERIEDHVEDQKAAMLGHNGGPPMMGDGGMTAPMTDGDEIGVYPYDVDGHPRQVFAQDFGNGVAIQPTADPNIFSTSQRLAIGQAVYQMAMNDPGTIDKGKAAKRVLQAMKVPDYEELLVGGKDVGDFDPVTENARILASLPVQAHPQQNHQAHLMVHTQFMQSPNFGGNPQVAQHVTPAMLAHIGQHMAYAYRDNFQQAGVQLPPIDPTTGDYQQQPPDTNQIAMASAQIAPQLMNAPGLPPTQPPQDQPDPVAQAKAAAIQAESQQRLQANDQAHQQALKQKQDLHQVSMQQTVEKAKVDQVKTAINIQTEQAKAAHDQQMAAQEAATYAALSEAEQMQALRHAQHQHILDVAHQSIDHAHDRAQAATDAQQANDLAEVKVAAEIKAMAKKDAVKPKEKPKAKPKKGKTS